MDKFSQEILIISGAASIFIITFFLVIVSVGIIMLVLVYQKRQLQYFKEREQLQSNFQQELLQSQLEIQEQTFKNISQEIHDNIGQVLTLAKLNVNSIHNSKPEDVEIKINDTNELLSKAIQDLRDIAKSLNSEFVSDNGLVKSIALELEMIQKAGNYEVCLKDEGTDLQIPNKKELILFRIVQEVLNNIVKHSKAAKIEVLITAALHVLSIQITDDGVGFNVSEIFERANKDSGLGIRNMQNRSHIIGANFKIVSDVAKGTTVTIELPLA